MIGKQATRIGTMVNWLLFCSFITSLAMTILGLMVDLSYQFTYEPQIHQWQTEQSQNLQSFLDNENRWAQHPVFQPLAKNKQDLATHLTNIRQGDLQKEILSPSKKKKFMAMGRKWLKQKHQVAEVDTLLDFFNDIEEFDQWTPIIPIKKGLATDFVVSGQLYLAFTYHFRPEEIRQALTKTRHLSRILLSTDHLNFKKAGLSLLEKENQLMQSLNDRYLKTQILWTPVAQTEINAFRKHLHQTASYLSHLTKPEILQKIFLKETKPLGYCAVFATKKPLILWGNQYLKPHFIFEPNFRKTTSTLDLILENGETRCPEYVNTKPPQKRLSQYIPYYRRLYAIKFILDSEKNRKTL